MDIDFCREVVDENKMDVSIENLVSILDGDKEFQTEIDDIAVGLYYLCL